MGELRAEVDGELAYGAFLVAHPVYMRVRQDLAVHPSPAAGAHLEDEVGERGADRVLHPIQALVVGDERVTPRQLRRQARCPASAGEIGIEIPLHPVDADQPQDAGQSFEDVIPRCRHAKIQHGALVRLRLLAVNMVQPLRMLGADRGRAADHFGLEPQAEQQSFRATGLRDCAQAVGKALAAGAPVARPLFPLGVRLAIVGAVPAGVDDKGFAADALGDWHQRHQQLSRRLAEIGIPTVKLHWDRSVAVRAPATPEIMELLGGNVERSAEAAEQHCRQSKRFAGGQPMSEVPVVEPPRQQDAILLWFDLHPPVARPENLAEVGLRLGPQRDVGLELESGLA